METDTVKIGVISARHPDYPPNERLREACAARGHEAVLVHPYRVWPVIHGGTRGFTAGKVLDGLRVVLPRQGATIGESCLALIRHLEGLGVPVVNGAAAVDRARNQFRALQCLTGEGIPVPDTVFVNEAEGFAAAVALLGGYPVVVKQVSSRQGEGVRLVETEEQTSQEVLPALDRRSGLVVQRFYPASGRSDLRVVVVGGEVAAAMALAPAAGDFRANVHLGGEPRGTALAPEAREVALRAANALGLEIAGVDLILDRDGGLRVLEVNYSPGFRGIESATGLDVAGRVVEYAVARAGSTQENTSCA